MHLDVRRHDQVGELRQAGDVTKTHLKWRDDKVPEGFSSPAAADGLIFRLHSPSTLRCWKAATGEVLFDERVEGVSVASSPFVTADGRLYLAGAGKTVVLRVGPKFEVLARNDLGDGSQASPAVADGRILLRGQRFLWCIGKKE